MILCVYCGNEMEDEARACPSCGKEVELPEDSQAVLEPETEETAKVDIENAESAFQMEGKEPEVEADNNPQAETQVEAEAGQETAAGEEQEDADTAAPDMDESGGIQESQAEETEPAPQTEDETAESREPAETTDNSGDESGEMEEDADANLAEDGQPSKEEESDINITEDSEPSEMEAGAEMAIHLDQPVAQKKEPVERGATMSLARAVSALVCGIAGVALCLVPVAGLVLSIIAMALGAKARSHTVNQRRGIAVAGFILGVVGLVVSIGALIWWIVVLTSGAKVFWLLGSLV